MLENRQKIKLNKMPRARTAPRNLSTRRRITVLANRLAETQTSRLLKSHPALRKDRTTIISILAGIDKAAQRRVIESARAIRKSSGQARKIKAGAARRAAKWYD